MGALERTVGRAVGTLARATKSHAEGMVVIPAQMIIALKNDEKIKRERHLIAYEQKIWALSLLHQVRWSLRR